MEEFDIYLFDFDGTLVDSHESLKLVFQRAYKRIGVDVSDDYIRRLMRISLAQGYEELNAPKDEESLKNFVDEIHSLLDDPEITKYTTMYDDVKQAILMLKSLGKKLGIVTSNKTTHVKEVLEIVGLDPSLFSAIVGNQETKRYKPFPDPILKALELMNAKDEKVCYVGDGLDDMRSAVAAKVYPILLDRLDEYGDSNHIVIKSLEELY